MDAVQVGAQCPDEREQDKGHQEGHQGQGQGGVGDDLQRQNLPMLQVGWLKRIRSWHQWMFEQHGQQTVTNVRY